MKLKALTESQIIVLNATAGASWFTIENLENLLNIGLAFANFTIACISVYSLIQKKRQKWHKNDTSE